MDKLWAPWRIKYITQKKKKGCIFCQIHNKKQDNKNFVIFRAKYCLAVLNIFPYNNGHTLLVPNRHIKTLEALTDQELIDINKSLIRMKKILKKTLRPAGFNIGINIGKVSGAGIDNHIHFHIVPRWLGDTNFMPITASTKIISQSLKELHKQLTKNI